MKNTLRSTLQLGKQLLALSGIIGAVGMVQYFTLATDKDTPRTSNNRNALAQSCPVMPSTQVTEGETEQERAVRFISCAGFLQ